jgi:hypothetical protein
MEDFRRGNRGYGNAWLNSGINRLSYNNKENLVVKKDMNLFASRVDKGVANFQQNEQAIDAVGRALDNPDVIRTEQAKKILSPYTEQIRAMQDEGHFENYKRDVKKMVREIESNPLLKDLQEEKIAWSTAIEALDKSDLDIDIKNKYKAIKQRTFEGDLQYDENGKPINKFTAEEIPENIDYIKEVTDIITKLKGNVEEHLASGELPGYFTQVKTEELTSDQLEKLAYDYVTTKPEVKALLEWKAKVELEYQAPNIKDNEIKILQQQNIIDENNKVIPIYNENITKTEEQIKNLKDGINPVTGKKFTSKDINPATGKAFTTEEKENLLKMMEMARNNFIKANENYVKSYEELLFDNNGNLNYENFNNYLSQKYLDHEHEKIKNYATNFAKKIESKKHIEDVMSKQRREHLNRLKEARYKASLDARAKKEEERANVNEYALLLNIGQTKQLTKSQIDLAEANAINSPVRVVGNHLKGNINIENFAEGITGGKTVFNKVSDIPKIYTLTSYLNAREAAADMKEHSKEMADKSAQQYLAEHDKAFRAVYDKKANTGEIITQSEFLSYWKNNIIKEYDNLQINGKPITSESFGKYVREKVELPATISSVNQLPLVQGSASIETENGISYYVRTVDLTNMKDIGNTEYELIFKSIKTKPSSEKKPSEKKYLEAFEKAQTKKAKTSEGIALATAFAALPSESKRISVASELPATSSAMNYGDGGAKQITEQNENDAYWATERNTYKRLYNPDEYKNLHIEVTNRQAFKNLPKEERIKILKTIEEYNNLSRALNEDTQLFYDRGMQVVGRLEQLRIFMHSYDTL